MHNSRNNIPILLALNLAVLIYQKQNPATQFLFHQIRHFLLNQVQCKSPQRLLLFSNQVGPLEEVKNIFVGLHLCAQIEPKLFEL